MAGATGNTVSGGRPSERSTFKGRVVSTTRLSGRSSSKETHHIVIGVDESIHYLPGDVAAILPKNKPEIVENLILCSGLDPETEIDHPKIKGTLQHLLSYHLNTAYLLRSTVSQYATLTGQEIPNTRMSLYDILRKYPLKSKEQFVEVLKLTSLLAPRLYSISSSPLAHGNHEIHLTVVKDRFVVEQQKRSGVGSKYLIHLEPGEEVEFFIQKSKHFKLPLDTADIIMVGPGTGIAPFRSFLYERAARQASGKNWLFFGEQHIESDFLYQADLLNFLQTGVLTHLDLAFSRDQQEKIYVQDRMREKGAALYNWVNKGAHIYICGKRDPMSRDVEAALADILMQFGSMTETEARKYLSGLSNQGRYQKDVY